MLASEPMCFPEWYRQGLPPPTGQLAATVLTTAFPPEQAFLDGAPIQEDPSRKVPGAQSQHQGSQVDAYPIDLCPVALAPSLDLEAMSAGGKVPGGYGHIIGIEFLEGHSEHYGMEKTGH